MSSLRELLEKQKQEKQNAKPVLQSKTVEKTQAISPEAISAERGTSSEAGKGVAIVNGTGTTGTAVHTPVVEPRSIKEMPAGLSVIQQIKWKKEHANNSQISPSIVGINSTTKQQTGPGLGARSIPNSENKINKTAKAVEKINVQPQISASQTADNQKTNDGTIDISALKRNLEYLANNIEQKELVGQVVRTIAIQLKNSPELTPFVSNADMNLIVRGARMAYNIQARKKAEAKDAKAKTKGNADELNAMFAAAGLGDLKLNLK